MSRIGMLSRLLMAGLAIEATIYVVIVAVAMALGLTLLPALGIVVLIAFAWRAQTMARIFRLAWKYRMKRAPEQCIRQVPAARLAFAEFFYMFWLYTVLHPFEWLLCRRDAPPDATGPAILCIHGYTCNGAFFNSIRRHLAQAGYTRTYTINMDPTFGDIEDHARLVGARVEQILRETGQKKIILLGHSMGGLVSRCYVQHHGGAAFVSKIVTLGTPHHGTYLAFGGRGENARQMRPGNPWLEALNAEPRADVPITSVYTYHDCIIAPQDSSELEGAHNIGFCGVGHLEMAFSKIVHGHIIDAIAEPVSEHHEERELIQVG